MRALVVDDSRAMRTLLGRMLRELGYDVIQAGNGQEALDLLAADSQAVDVALVDWNMAVMNGPDFVSVCRSDPRLRGVTLMMVTSESGQTQIVRALAAGAHEYLIKPFTADALRAKLDLLGLGAAP